MFCYKCGKELPSGANNCPDCGLYAKRNKRVVTRMALALIIFILGGISGILIDRTVLQRKLPEFGKNEAEFSNTENIVSEAKPEVKSADVKETVEHKNNIAQPRDENAEIAKESKTAPVGYDAGKVLYKEADYAEAEREKIIENDEKAQAGEMENNNAAAELPELKPEEEKTSEENDEVNAEKLQKEQAPKADGEKYGYVQEKIVYKKCLPLEEGNYNSWHGILSNDGAELVFSSDRLLVNGKRTYQCFAKKLNESKAERVFLWNGNVWTPEPVNGTDKIVFSSDCLKNEHIFVYGRKTGVSSQLTFGDSKNMMPAVSQDGKQIVFVSNRGGMNHIWIMDSDGQGQKQLTFGNFEDREPRWFDNGKAIVFTRIYEKLKKSHILKLSLLDNSIIPIVEADSRNWMPDMAPNGELLAFTRSEGDKGSKNSIVLRDMKTGDETVLSLAGRVENMRPVWNSDSLGFIYHSIVKTGRSLHMAIFERERK